MAGEPPAENHTKTFLMDFIGFPTNFRTTPAWLLASSTQRGTWMALQFYCASAENLGVIADCSDWTSRTWECAAAVTKADVDDACDLYFWEGGDLHVLAYDIVGEESVKASRGNSARERGRLGGQSKSEKKVAAARVNGAAAHQPKRTQADPSTTQAGTQADNPSNPSEGKGREAEGKGSEAKDDETTRGREEWAEDGETSVWLDTAEAVRVLNPLFGHPADVVPSAMVMEAAHRIFPAGVPRSKLLLIEAFYAAAPDFRNRSSWGRLHEDDPRRFRKFKLGNLIDEFADQCALAERWQSGAWRDDGKAVENAQKKERGGAKLPPFPWRKVARYVLQWLVVPETDEHWFGLDSELKKQVAGAWRSLTPEQQAALETIEESDAMVEEVLA